MMYHGCCKSGDYHESTGGCVCAKTWIVPSWNVDPPITPIGWICPNCKRGIAPSLTVCPCVVDNFPEKRDSLETNTTVANDKIKITFNQAV